MRKQNYRRALLAGLIAAIIALGVAAQSPARADGEQPAFQQLIAGSKAEKSFGRELS